MKKVDFYCSYPDGFDVELGVFANYSRIATAISGDLLKVKIRASVQSMPLTVAARRRGRGELSDVRSARYRKYHDLLFFPG
jgi:hypothetical protein